MPQTVQPEQLAHAHTIQAAARDTLGFRHPGPAVSHLDPVAIAAQGLSRPQTMLADPNEVTFQPVTSTPARQPADQQWVSARNLAPPPAQAIYVKSCKKCSWTTIPTSDPLAYPGAVADYESHLREDHPESKDSGDSSSKSKETEEYKRATTLTLIGPGIFYEQEAQEGVDSTPPMKTLFWPGMSCFDYIPPKIHIIGDDMQKFRSQISKIKI